MYYLTIKKDDNIDILLVTIYDKAELDTISKRDADLLLKKVLAELALKK